MQQRYVRRDDAGEPAWQDTYRCAVLRAEWGKVASGGGAAV